MSPEVERLIERFGLTPHPEGGYFREVYRARLEIEHPGVPADHPPRRRAGTFIYMLLAERQFSAFHRVRWTDEIWHVYAGAPLELHLIHADGRYEQRTLGCDVERSEPAAVVAAGCWQAARIEGGSGWTLAGCTVAPGFEYDDFEMPPAKKLLQAYPEHARIIGELTRS
jgi:uncharacterized protein